MAKANVKERQDFQNDMAKMVQKYYEKGYDDGHADAMNSVKPAISDGLRKGSSECGKAMQIYKKRNN